MKDIKAVIIKAVERSTLGLILPCLFIKRLDVI